MSYEQVILIILDGWGYREEKNNNAIAEAETPFFDSLWKDYPHGLLRAADASVGLPEGQIGNSEVGHMTIGAGTVIDTDLVRIAKDIANGQFNDNPAFLRLFQHVKKYGSTLHVLGLVSPGGVHSHQDHLHAFLAAAKRAGVAKLAVHAFTDGRDMPPKSSHLHLKALERSMSDLGLGFIATATGRYYAMDRDKNWDRLAKAEAAIFNGQGSISTSEKPSSVMGRLHEQGKTDEYMEPVVFLDESGKVWKVNENDGIFLFNFRADRARQISQRIVERSKGQNLMFATLTEYSPDLAAFAAYPAVKIQTTLAAEISKAGMSQAHIAETEKYAHATYYLNGGRQEPYPNEKHILIDTRKDVKTHDQAPEMRAKEIADEAIGQVESGTNFIFINFANADVVGHTGNREAIIKAVETLDHQLERIVKAAQGRGAAVFITADHGNAEMNMDHGNGQPHTAHTTSPVPAIAVAKGKRLLDGALADVAPTILHMLGLPQPSVMNGKNLLS